MLDIINSLKEIINILIMENKLISNEVPKPQTNVLCS